MTNGLRGDLSNHARRVWIAGTGRAVPDRVLTNADLEKIAARLRHHADRVSRQYSNHVAGSDEAPDG